MVNVSATCIIEEYDFKYDLYIIKNASGSPEPPLVFRISGNDPPWLWSGS